MPIEGHSRRKRVRRVCDLFNRRSIFRSRERSVISGELCIPESHDMRKRAPDAVRLAAQRIAMQDNGWDVQ